jgi:hypothetical protein
MITTSAAALVARMALPHLQPQKTTQYFIKSIIINSLVIN